MPRGTMQCVECGAAKLPGEHPLTQRCDGCRPAFQAAMLAANAAVSKARARGLLPTPKSLACSDCGGAAHDYDHRDYSRPLDVQPVCRACNFKRGPAKYERAAA
jgi:hypothetical protein